MKCISIVIVCLVIPFLTWGQGGEIKIKDKVYPYELDLGLGTYYQFTTLGRTDLHQAKIPSSLPRRINEPAIRRNWGLDGDEVTDHPFFHGSYFFKLGTRFYFGQSLTVTGALIAEQRGFSDGIFSERTRNFYPYLNLDFSNAIGELKYFFQVGDFRNFKLYEGLTYDNLETQGWVVKLSYRQFFLRHAGIGDLFRSIGLGIDDLYDYALGIEKLDIAKDSALLLTLQAGYSNNRAFGGSAFWNLSGQLQRGPLALSTQVSAAENGGIAGVIGLSLEEQQWGEMSLSSSLAFRWYEAEFNQFFQNSVLYRNPAEAAFFTNSTHTTFVPLDYYERDFNQWAVYTEYQNLDISGINLVSDLSYRIYKTVFLLARMDFNWLITDSETFLYPFYQTGIGLRPQEDIEISLRLTNKAVNLDKDFPTFYAAKKPYLMLRLFRPLRMIRENDRKGGVK